MIRHAITLAACLCLWLPPLRAQGPGSLPLRVYGVQQGMTSEVISSLAQDAQGVIWAGTEAGVHFFDGHTFVPFQGELPAPMILDLLPDPDGSVWVATQGGLARIRAGRSEREPDFPTGNTRQLAQGADGALWVLTSRGLMVRKPGGRFIPALLPAGGVPNVLLGHPGLPGIWVGVGQELLRWEAEGKGWVVQPSPPMATGEVFLGIAMDGAGQLWARTPRKLWRQPAGRPWQLCRSGLESGFSSLARLNQDSQGWVWFDDPRGFWRGKGDELELMVPPSVVGRGALVDRDGGIWLRTQKGVARILGGMRWRSYGVHEGLPSPTVWLSVRDSKGRLWVATEEGLCVAQGSTWKRVIPSRILVLALGQGNTLWAGGSPGGTVHQIDLGTLAVQAHRVDVLPVSRIISGLVLDGEGRPWVADADAGLARGRRVGGGWIWEKPDMGGLALKSLRNVISDAQGRILVAHEDGVSVWHQGQWTQVQGVLGKEQASNLAFNDQGELTVGYMNRPVLTRHRLENGIYRLFETREPFLHDPQMLIFSLGYESTGTLWMGTSKGAARLTAGPGDRVRLFRTEDGLVSPDCDEGALFVEKDRVWIGTSQGLAVVRTDLPEMDPPLQAPVLLNAQSGGKPLDRGTGRVVLPPGSRSLDLQFLIPSYQASGRLTYQARLGGEDSEWITLESPRIRYPAISPGRYQLELRGILDDGRVGPTLGFPFEVPHHWWESPAAWTGYSLAAGVAIVGLVRLRQYQLVVRNRDLAQEVARQTQAVLAASQAKSAFLANMSHELRTPLNAILLYSELLQEDATEHGLTGIQEDASKIYGAGKHLLGLIDDILDVSKIEAGHMKLHLEDVEMAPFLADLIATLEPVVERNGNRFLTDLDRAPTRMCTDPVRLRQILSNLLGNAGKFTENGEVRLSVEQIYQEAYFTVRDTGIGMSKEEMQRVFQEFVQAHTGTTRKYGGTGLGLALVRRFTSLLGGVVEADSVPGEGTTFVVRLPLSGPTGKVTPEAAGGSQG